MSLDSHTKQATPRCPERRPQERQPGTPAADKKRFDCVTAAIWRNKHDNGKASFSVTFSRSYLVNTNGHDEWRDTGHFAPRDLPHLQLAVEWSLKQLLLKPE